MGPEDAMAQRAASMRSAKEEDIIVRVAWNAKDPNPIRIGVNSNSSLRDLDRPIVIMQMQGPVALPSPNFFKTCAGCKDCLLSSQAFTFPAQVNLQPPLRSSTNPYLERGRACSCYTSTTLSAWTGAGSLLQFKLF